MKNPVLLGTTILGGGICLLLGIGLFGATLMNIERPPLYFVFVGLLSSLTLGLFSQQRFRDAIYLDILLYILFVVIVLQLRFPTSLILLNYMVFVIAGVYLFVEAFEKKLPDVFMIRSLLLAALVAVFSIPATIVHHVAYGSFVHPNVLMVNLPFAFLIGLGCGIGFEIAGRLFVDHK